MTKHDATYLVRFIALEKQIVALYAELATLENDHAAYARTHTSLMAILTKQSELLATYAKSAHRSQANALTSAAIAEVYA